MPFSLVEIYLDTCSILSFSYLQNVRSLYALVTTAVRNTRALTRLFSEIQLLENESRLDPWLARILTTEILLGKKALPGHSKPEQTLLAYKEQIENFPNKHPELFDFTGNFIFNLSFFRSNTALE